MFFNRVFPVRNEQQKHMASETLFEHNTLKSFSVPPLTLCKTYTPILENHLIIYQTIMNITNVIV